MEAIVTIGILAIIAVLSLEVWARYYRARYCPNDGVYTWNKMTSWELKKVKKIWYIRILYISALGIVLALAMLIY